MERNTVIRNWKSQYCWMMSHFSKFNGIMYYSLLCKFSLVQHKFCKFYWHIVTYIQLYPFKSLQLGEYGHICTQKLIHSEKKNQTSGYSIRVVVEILRVMSKLTRVTVMLSILIRVHVASVYSFVQNFLNSIILFYLL